VNNSSPVLRGLNVLDSWLIPPMAIKGRLACANARPTVRARSADRLHVRFIAVYITAPIPMPCVAARCFAPSIIYTFMRTFVVMVALIAILSGDASTTVIRVQAAGWSFGVQRQLLHDSVVEVNCPGIAASICTRANPINDLLPGPARFRFADRSITARMPRPCGDQLV